jgi:hypothetical protein
MPYLHEIQTFVKNTPEYRNHVTFLAGTPLKSDDLVKCAMVLSPDFEACFVLSNSSDNRESHTQKISIAVSINRTVNQPSKMFNLDFMKTMGLGRQCVFSMRIKMNVLATSYIAHRFSVLLTNLNKHARKASTCS